MVGIETWMQYGNIGDRVQNWSKDTIIWEQFDNSK